MHDLTLDVRLALRAFARKPAFTAVVVLTLGLGIGANTAIFSLLDQALFRLLPVKDPQGLVVLDAPGPFAGSTHHDGRSVMPLSHPMFERLGEDHTVFSGLLAHYPTTLHLSADGQTERVSGALVSGSFFQVLGLDAAAGRLLTPDDDRVPGAHPVVVLSHRFWSRRFAADRKVVGRSVTVNGEPMTVVGVAPRGFQGVDVGDPRDVFVPLMMQAQVIPTWDRGIGDWRARWLIVLARLREGVSIDQARARANTLYRQLLQEDLDHATMASERARAAFLQKTLALRPAGRGLATAGADVKMPLFLLMGMVALVLLTTCANVASLLLARATSRQKEMAVQLALGATRARMVRKLLLESLLLALAGGLLGVVVAGWTLNLLIGVLPEGATTFSAEPDLRVGLFALAVSLLTALVFGLMPARQATRAQIAPILKNETGTLAGSRGPMRFRKGLVVAQIAFSTLLLVGAGLFARSLMNLRALNPGFQPERLLTFEIEPALSGYDLPRRLSLFAALREALAAEPGVRSVSMATVPLMTDSTTGSTVKVDGYPAREGEDMNPAFNVVGPGFFATLGIPLLAGRDFTEADGPTAARVAVVNEVFARYFFGDGDPIGRRFSVGRAPANEITIVGLVRDGKAATLREEPRRFVYLPYRQSPRLADMTFYVRSEVDPEALAAPVRRVVQRLDAALPPVALKTMAAQIGESLLVDRLVAWLSAAFGLLATFLSAIGLFGVMSYAVSLRTREIGIRVALGAERRAVLGMVLKEVMVLALAGVALGLPSGYGLGRLAETQLFHLRPHDPLTLALATSSLLLAALLAGYLPAARATRIDPVVALRYE